MSESPDQSYYEIALTNRQVVSIFVVLLFCVLVAFLGGVWLGRGADAAVEVASAQSITAGLAASEAPLEELDFFNRDRPQLGSGAVGRSTEPERAPAKDEQPRAASREPDWTQERNGTSAGREGSSGSEAPSAGITAVETAAPVAQTPVGSVTAAPPITPTAAPAGAKTAAAGVPDFVVIQVFSSNEESQADRVVSRLRKGGYPAVLSPVDVDGRTLYRVRIGPYTDRDEAQVVADSVRRSFKLDTWITH